jgi:hypothetical protein
MTETTEITPAAPAPEPAAGEDASSPGKRLTQSQWIEIEAHWEYATKSGADICREYGISASALTQHFKRRAAAGFTIKRGSKAHILKKEAETKVAGAAATTTAEKVSFAAKRPARIEATRETLYNASLANHVEFNKIQRDIGNKTVTPASQLRNIQALRHMELLIKQNIENRLKILDAEASIDEEEIPTLTIRDLTDDEIKNIRNSQGEDEEVDLALPEAPPDADEDVIEEGVPPAPKAEDA